MQHEQAASKADVQQRGAEEAQVAKERVVVVGASAGGVAALQTLASRLPVGFPATVLVVLHIPSTLPSDMPQLLTEAGPLPALHGWDGAPLLPGRIYVAPPDRHLLVGEGAVRLSRGPRENFTRPAINPLFRAAAQVYGSQCAGVILSGALDDGVAGLEVVKEKGGLTIAQDPREALFQSMPANAIRRISVDYVLPAADIAGLLTRWACEEKFAPKAWGKLPGIGSQTT